jgi:hypothetical protein
VINNPGPASESFMPFDLLKALLRTAQTPARQAHGRHERNDSFVAFVTPISAPHFVAPGERLDSDQASVRLRVGVPARELARTRRVCLVPLDYVLRDPALSGLGCVSATVIGKLPVRFFTEEAQRAEALLEWIEDRARARRIIVDFSDDLAAAATMYSQPSLARIQSRLLGACAATVPSAALRSRLLADARHGVTVIEDPYESSQSREPRFEPGAVLRLVWFGVFGPPLRSFIEREFMVIARSLAPRPVELAFVTSAEQAPLVAQMAAALRAVHPAFVLRHVAWSVEATASELDRADIVVLPQDAGSDWGRVKSHNRLVEAIRAGRFAVASAIPAYRELADHAWVGDDLAAGIEWALAHPREVSSRLGAGRIAVGERFSPARIAACWADVLDR